MDVKKAENIIDRMYKDKMKIRERQTKEGLELDLSKNVTFTELEEASVILLRNYLKSKRKDEEKDKQIDFIINFIYEVLCKYPGTISHALRRNGFNDNECGTCENTNKNCIKCLKLYFESKSKEE